MLIFLVGYAIACLARDPGPEERAEACRIIYVTLIFAVYGLFRFGWRHPAFAVNGHSKWLLTTPWTSRLPLPKGPVQLTWRDGLALACVVLLVRLTTVFPSAIPIIAFGAAYELVATMAFVTTIPGSALVLALAFGLIVRFGGNRGRWLQYWLGCMFLL